MEDYFTIFKVYGGLDTIIEPKLLSARIPVSNLAENIDSYWPDPNNYFNFEWIDKFHYGIIKHLAFLSEEEACRNYVDEETQHFNIRTEQTQQSVGRLNVAINNLCGIKNNV
jgi:hypothetical protein